MRPLSALDLRELILGLVALAGDLILGLVEVSGELLLGLVELA
jgi:hypothetical protein